MDFWEAFDIDHRVQDRLEADLFEEKKENKKNELSKNQNKRK